MPERDIYKYSESETLLRGARWARADELMSGAFRVRLSDKKGKFHGGLPLLSDGDTVYLDDSDAHSLIIGSTGSKKTRLFVMPMMELFCRAEESVVVTDPKGELYDLTAGEFAKNGYHINVINLREPYRSDGWNPFLLARRYHDAGDKERAASIVNDFASAFIPDVPGAKVDPFWTQTARAVLQGVAHLMVEGGGKIKESEVNLHTLRSLSAGLASEEGNSSQQDTTFALLDHYPAESLARSNLDAIRRCSEKTFENIMVSFNAPMQRLYLQRSLSDMLSVNNVDFARLGQEKTVLYLVVPDEKTTLHIVASMIIKQCYEQLILLAQGMPGNRLPRRVNFLLDEFSNLPAIPDMPSMISAARSRNLRFHLIVQGLYQLSAKYGQDDAQTLKGNCGNWVFLTSRELPLLQEISNLCGSDARTGEQLISVSQLQRLDKEKGEALMLIGRHYPYIARLPDIERYGFKPGAPRPLPTLDKSGIAAISPEEIISRMLDTPGSGALDSSEQEEEFDLQAKLENEFSRLFGKKS